jgi:hypothetical protein
MFILFTTAVGTHGERTTRYECHAWLLLTQVWLGLLVANVLNASVERVGV